jgi:hypothetical protein
MPRGPDWTQYVVRRPGASGPASYSWGPSVCASIDIRPEYRTLNESSLVAFLRGQQLAVRVERQPVEPHKPELVFLFVEAPGAADPVPLRVAILPSADEAGKALSDGLVERGAGVWGIHRSNLAVLGPAGATEDDLAFAAKTKLACWGTFSFYDSGDVFVVPGGYAEP